MSAAARILWLAASLAVAAALVAGWQFITDVHLVSPVFLPSPTRAWQALVSGFAAEDIGAQTAATVERMFYGWVLASVIGVALGALIGSSWRAQAYLGPTLEFIRPLPASAVAPIAIAFLGLSNAMVLGIVAFGTLWPMLLATVHGFAAVSPRLKEVARILKFSRAQVIWKIALPTALPDILAGMRLGLTVALILTIVGEMLTGQDGLGRVILLAARSFQAPQLYAGVILLGVIGLVSNALLSVLDRWLLRWRPAH
jgi:ABC-type nitrate/sulfonate/bicarbonate transport system permease component